MTLNSVIKRIEQTSLSHAQIKNFYFGKPTDFLTEKTTRYASIFLEDNGATIDSSAKATTLRFRMWALDLVHVSEDTKANEQDVESDMLSISEDLIASMSQDSYQDWAFGTSNSVTFVQEEFDDLVAGVVVDIEIRVPYLRDVCAIPTN